MSFGDLVRRPVGLTASAVFADPLKVSLRDADYSLLKGMAACVDEDTIEPALQYVCRHRWGYQVFFMHAVSTKCPGLRSHPAVVAWYDEFLNLTVAQLRNDTLRLKCQVCGHKGVVTAAGLMQKHRDKKLEALPFFCEPCRRAGKPGTSIEIEDIQ